MMPPYRSDDPDAARYTRYPTPPDDDAPVQSEADENAVDNEPSVIYRGAGSDPTFGYLVALALTVGLMPLIPDNIDLRYVLVWLVMAGFGTMAWLMGNSARIERETLGNLVWGVIFGLIISAPLVLVGGGTLTTTAHLLFRVRAGEAMQPLTLGSALALLVFVQPLAETLFFRGVFQENRPFWLVGVLASVFVALLYLPLLDVGNYPGVGVIIVTAIVLMNMTYSYVRQRSGLAAAWLCQIVVNVVLLFFPFLMS